ncbi:TRAP transporter substrate-binding protein [Desulfoscipio geothermicus]|uniref:Tripartite ATP-independent transporter solute receptor, DctP family n=1 Tax=Desulfoscipio geothermicus DSM 3669 TaxID=1121426 RepID=A0A1I6DLN8_9FIRM|nr:TRAP transporter substrate-binding protein [Desulfoscipio geothermicus]SFR06375.1 tripartite ATP-independent transporter solute receptor, DctP family [Desulfoscipio geothermicus DSM 3669]
MSLRKAAWLVAILLVLSLVVLGCAAEDKNKDQAGGEAEGKIILKAGHAVAESHPYHLGLEKFKQIVEEKTGGQVQIDIYANGTIGSERDMIEGLQLGTIDLVLTSTGPVINFVPEMGVVDLPFLFSSREHAYQVLDGEIGQDLLEQFGDIGIVGLAFWENGFRNLTNSERPINSVEDIQGLKIRTMENEVHQAAFKELGADPTPMAWGEVYTALQQKTIDGQENPIPIIYNMKIYEVQKYLALTGHFYSPALLLIGQKSLDKLSPEQQNIIKKAAVEAATYEREQIKVQEDEQLAKLEEKGMVITRPDKNALREATMAVYEKYEGRFGKDTIQKILNADPNKK